MKITLLLDKYCDLKPELGVTSALANVVGSISCTDIHYNCLFYDEYYSTHNEPIDNFLLKFVDTDKPDAIFISYYPFRNVVQNISMDTLDKLKEKGIPTIFIWFDFVHDSIQRIVVDIAEHNALNVVVDTFVELGPRYLPMTVPQDEKLFCWSDNKPVNVSFIGSQTGYFERDQYLSKLKNVFISGGQRQAGLTIEQYAQCLKDTKISLNFPRKHDGSLQAKSRIYESMLCGAMLMEVENDAITRWFEPYVHYVPFNEHDVESKIEFYLNNEQERLRIAKNGYKKMKSDYSAQNWWNKVLNSCLL